MSDVLKARSEDEAAQAVRDARAAGATLELKGRGTKSGLGRAAAAGRVLDLSGLSGITLYEPEELVLAARPGTAMVEIADALAARSQMLAFEPPDLGPLLGRPAGEGSLGGVFACGLSGPRRLSAGAVRDHALGVRGVSGRGEVFKAGGRVVKNVTGYDLPRLMAGAHGTLAALTEITLKVLPRPATEATLLVAGLGVADAARALSAAMGSSCEVTGAAWLPASVAARVPGAGTGPVAALRLEGVGPSVTARRAMLAGVLAPFGAAEMRDEDESRALWAALRDVAPFAGGEEAVWRLSTAPTRGPALAEALARDLGGEAFCDWAGGLIWLRLAGPAPQAEAVRAALAPHGGHATLMRASAAARAETAVFQPLEPALAALTARVKESFDPDGLLNPGRMYAGL